MRALGPQGGLGVSLEDSPGAIERLVDGLDGNGTSMVDSEHVSDLLGAPMLVEVALHEFPKLSITLEPALLRAWPAGEHQGVGRMGAVLGAR